MKHYVASIVMMTTWSTGNALAQPDPAESSTVIEPATFNLLHLPHTSAIAGLPLEFMALVDGPWMGDELLMHYRQVASSNKFQEVPFERSPGGELYATIPGDSVQVPGVEYYIVGRSPTGKLVQHFASMQAPHRVAVNLSFEDEWKRTQARRLQGYMSGMRVLVETFDFHSKRTPTDSFTRAELEWTHHFLNFLHAVSIGYGWFNGQMRSAPDVEQPVNDESGYRYGYGSINLRLHPKLWIHGRAMLGVDNDGFTPGGRVVVTIGKPWGASVDLGGEHIEGLEPSAWLRLQWDTVPKVLMGATVMKTNLPSADGPFTGSVITYDLNWQASACLSVLARISLAARDGSANPGGGLGAAWAF